MVATWLSSGNAKPELIQQQPNPYGRILSLYPLAAMINHSCQPNAVRVYSCSTCSNNSNSSNNNSSSSNSFDTEVMAVHATQTIQKGEEIVWSYVPTTRPYYDRQRRLKETFGFNCGCSRCVTEGTFFNDNGNENGNDDDDEDGISTIANTNNTQSESSTTSSTNDTTLLKVNIPMIMTPFEKWNTKARPISELPPPSDFHNLMSNLESLLNDKRIIPSGELCRYIRAGMVTFYTNYFNVILSSISQRTETEIAMEMEAEMELEKGVRAGASAVASVGAIPILKKDVLSLAAKVHLSLAAVDHGTTEHLSILHLCYELANELCRSTTNANIDVNVNLNLPKFYSTQLQKAHLCRYGQLGGKVELLREVMVHSRGVLRRIQGFEQAKYCFI